MKRTRSLGLVLLLIYFVELKTLEEEDDSDDFFTFKCARSKLEQDMWEFKKAGSVNFLPRLRDMKRLYPGDKFVLSGENMCRDQDGMCPILARAGQCTGADWHVRTTDRCFFLVIIRGLFFFIWSINLSTKMFI